MKRFSEGERVLVRTGLLGRTEKQATIAADFHGIGGEQVLVVFEGKTKPKAVAPATVRPLHPRPSLRVVPSSSATSSPRTSSPSTKLVRVEEPAAPVPLRAVPKALPDRDPRYLAFVRGHACCSCGSHEDVEAHHWARRGQKGLATKPSDFATVPLCRRCHDTWHATGALPKMNGPQSKFWFLAKQVDLLIAWIHELTSPRRSRKERPA